MNVEERLVDPLREVVKPCSRGWCQSTSLRNRRRDSPGCATMPPVKYTCPSARSFPMRKSSWTNLNGQCQFGGDLRARAGVRRRDLERLDTHQFVHVGPALVRDLVPDATWKFLEQCRVALQARASQQLRPAPPLPGSADSDSPWVGSRGAFPAARWLHHRSPGASLKLSPCARG